MGTTLLLATLRHRLGVRLIRDFQTIDSLDQFQIVGLQALVGAHIHTRLEDHIHRFIELIARLLTTIIV